MVGDIGGWLGNNGQRGPRHRFEMLLQLRRRGFDARRGIGGHHDFRCRLAIDNQRDSRGTMGDGRQQKGKQDRRNFHAELNEGALS